VIPHSAVVTLELVVIAACLVAIARQLREFWS